MAAARIKFNKKSGQYEIESFGNQYIKATKRPPLEIGMSVRPFQRSDGGFGRELPAPLECRFVHSRRIGILFR
jgi:hypothetical protein